MSLFQLNFKSIRPLHDSVLVVDMNFSQRITSGGIILPSDDGSNSGIRPRWARVYAVGPDQHDVQVGQYICVSHGRWTRGVTLVDDHGEKVIRRVDNKDILLVSDQEPSDDTLSDKVL